MLSEHFSMPWCTIDTCVYVIQMYGDIIALSLTVNVDNDQFHITNSSSWSDGMWNPSEYGDSSCTSNFPAEEGGGGGGGGGGWAGVTVVFGFTRNTLCLPP